MSGAPTIRFALGTMSPQFKLAAQCTQMVVEGCLTLFALGLVRIGQIGDVHTAPDTGRTGQGRLLDPVPETAVVDSQITGAGFNGHFLGIGAMVHDM